MTKSKKSDGYYSNNSDGSLCSGYGFFPNNSKCKGCSDCKGKPPKTMKELKKVFDQNHAVIRVSTGFNLKTKLTQKKHEINRIPKAKIKSVNKKS